MYKLCKTEQSALRQRTLELELLKAMSSQRYEEITVIDLCQRIGIPRKSFYRYFSGKEGALHALIDHTILEFETRFSPYDISGHSSFQQGLELFFRFWREQKPLLDALSRSNLSGVLIERAVANAVKDPTTDRFLSPDLRSLREQAAMFGVCGLMSMVVTWHREGYRHDVTHMARLATRLLTQPLFSEVVSR